MKPRSTSRSRMAQAALAGCALVATVAGAKVGAPPKHNVIFFVPDGLRAASVNETDAPEMTKLMHEGVEFTNTHAVYPTLTTVNASAFATGHFPGDTGNFGNTIHVGFPVKAVDGASTPFLENDGVLDEIDDHFAGNYLHEESLLAGARAHGYQTAAIGKTGPTAIQDLGALRGDGTLLIDESFGRSAKPVPAELRSWIEAAGLVAQAPEHDMSAPARPDGTGGMHTAAIAQVRYFADVAARAILPNFAKSDKPFALVFWSRDPDMTQHGTGDSINRLTPGINGPTSRAAVRNADRALGELRAALHDLHLENSTDIIVAADHGFTTIAKMSTTSVAAKTRSPLVPPGELPPGFLALDLAHALRMRAFDTAPPFAEIGAAAGKLPPHGSVYLGADAAHPQFLVVANGGSDFLYFTGSDALRPGSELTPRIKSVVHALSAEDYISGIFVDDRFGAIPGTLGLSNIHLTGSAVMPRPAVIVGFRSFTTNCRAAPLLCTAAIADTGLLQGQGMHGGFSRAETKNFVAAAGPDFRRAYRDDLPVGNADVGRTIGHLTGATVPDYGHETGRVLQEILPGIHPLQHHAAPHHADITSPAGDGGLRTVLRTQTYAGVRYIDAAGYRKRTVGL